MIAAKNTASVCLISHPNQLKAPMFNFKAPLPQSQILLQKVTASTIQIVVRLLPTNAEPTPRTYDRGHHPNRLRPYQSRMVSPLDEDEADDYHHSDGYVVVIYSNKSEVFTDVIFESGCLKYEFTSLAPTTAYTIRIIPSDARGEVLEKTAVTRKWDLD